MLAFAEKFLFYFPSKFQAVKKVQGFLSRGKSFERMAHIKIMNFAARSFKF